MFIEKYLKSLTTSDLRDDDQHRQTEALAAAALADLTGGSGDVMGSLLARAKFANGVPRKTFESGNHDVAVLLRAWIKVVTQKGLSRQWIKIIHAWDIDAAHSMYAKIARSSLAYWLGGECTACNGTAINGGRSCTRCAELPGREPIQGGWLEREKIADMTSELEGLYQSHAGRAAVKMRKAA